MKERLVLASSTAMLLVRNVLSFIVFWILSFGFVQFGERALGGWPASEAGQLLGCALGVALALRTRARVTAYLLAAMAAYSASELAIHSLYGIRGAQGASTHLAVIGAALLGVAFGALLVRRDGGRLAPHPVSVTSVAAGHAAESTTDDAGAWKQRSRLPLQPTSGSRRRSRFEPKLGAARG